MKTTIVNTLILILIFNLIMLIFPEGKTQKFCSISIKTLIMIFILDNIILNGSLNLDILNQSAAPAYQREIYANAISPDMVGYINDMFEEDVVKDIKLCFTESMEIKADVILYSMPDKEELNKLKSKITDIFKLNPDNIDFIYGGIHE